MPSAVLSGRRDAGGGLLLVTLLVQPAVAAAYRAPGQYVEVTVPKGTGFFVLGSEPGDTAWELLVRNAGDAADALATLPVGSPIDVSRPHGAGFPVERARGRALAVAVVGSALGAARPVLRRRIAEGEGARTAAFVGVRSAADVPLASEVDEWSRHARVVLCLSKAELDHHRAVLPGAARAAGYVQDAVRASLDASTLAPDALVFAAGPSAMLAALRDLGRRSSSSLEVVSNV